MFACFAYWNLCWMQKFELINTKGILVVDPTKQFLLGGWEGGVK